MKYPSPHELGPRSSHWTHWFRRGWALGLAGLLACVLVASAAAAVYHGTEGNDYIVGSQGDDDIYGYGGKDLLRGRNGVDYIFGGQYADEIHGGLDADALYGEGGRDTILAGCPDAACDPGSDNRLHGLGNDDILGAENGRPDYVDGGTGWDVCFVDSIDVVFRCEDIR